MLPGEFVNTPSVNQTENHWRQYNYSHYSVHDACNLKESNLERPRPDTGYVA